jgi:Skp family chaperone for outer membrane proteins
MSLARIAEMQNLLDNLKSEYEKFETKGNQVAGTRSRKLLQDIKNLSQDIRLHIQEAKRQKDAEGN